MVIIKSHGGKKSQQLALAEVSSVGFHAVLGLFL